MKRTSQQRTSLLPKEYDPNVHHQAKIFANDSAIALVALRNFLRLRLDGHKSFHLHLPPTNHRPPSPHLDSVLGHGNNNSDRNRLHVRSLVTMPTPRLFLG
jgi:hypothetical protein